MDDHNYNLKRSDEEGDDSYSSYTDESDHMNHNDDNDLLDNLSEISNEANGMSDFEDYEDIIYISPDPDNVDDFEEVTIYGIKNEKNASTDGAERINEILDTSNSENACKEVNSEEYCEHDLSKDFSETRCLNMNSKNSSLDVSGLNIGFANDSPKNSRNNSPEICRLNKDFNKSLLNISRLNIESGIDSPDISIDDSVEIDMLDSKNSSSDFTRLNLESGNNLPEISGGTLQEKFNVSLGLSYLNSSTSDRDSLSTPMKNDCPPNPVNNECSAEPEVEMSPVVPQIKKRRIDWKAMIPPDDPNSSGSEYVPTDGSELDESDESDESDCCSDIKTSVSSNTNLNPKNKISSKVNTRPIKSTSIVPYEGETRTETMVSKLVKCGKQSLLKKFSVTYQEPLKESLTSTNGVDAEVFHAENEDNEQSSEPSTSTSPKTKGLVKKGKKYLLKLYSEKTTLELEAPVSEGDNVNENKENGQSGENMNIRKSETSTSNLRSSRFVAKTTNVSSSDTNVNSLKRKRNGIDDLDLPTQTIAFSDEGGKWYNKLNCCCFCYSLELRVDRHYRSHHPEEPEVQFLFHCKVPSEKKAKYKELRLRGNNFYNNDKTLNPNGIIICSRRVSRKKVIEKKQLLEENDEEDFPLANEKSSTNESTIASSISSKTDVNARAISGVFKLKCSQCSMWVVPQNLRNHFRLNHPNIGDCNSKQILKEAKRGMLDVHPKTDSRVKDHIFAKIRDPVTSAIVRHDILIVLFANKFVDKFVDAKQLDMVRGYVRLLAKFMIEMKKLNSEIKEFKMVFNTEYWDDVIKAMRIVSKYDERTQRFGITYNAETLPILFRKCFKILRHHLVTIKDQENVQNLNDFIAFFDDDIQNAISIKACLSRKELNRHTNDKALPLSKDIVIFREYLDLLRQQVLDAIKASNSISYDQYLALMSCVALLIETFNRRRNAEVAKTLLEDFDSIKIADKNSEFFLELTQEEKDKRLEIYRIDILGKRFDGKGSLYIDDLDYDCLKLLRANRNKFNIPDTNPYLFATKNGRDNGERYINMYDSMCKYTKKCNAEYKRIDPDAIRSTALRKHAATVNGTMDNGKNTTMCAELLGHSERIQKSKYKRIVDKQDVDKVSFLKQINSIRYNSESVPQQSQPEKPAQPNLLDSSNDEVEEAPAAIKKGAWDKKECSAFREEFQIYLSNRKTPSSPEIRKVRSQNQYLNQRSLAQIITRFSNIYTGKLKRY